MLRIKFSGKTATFAKPENVTTNAKKTAEALKKLYSNLPTQKLLEIVDNKFDYTDLAVQIALSALSTRQVNTKAFVYSIVVTFT